MASAKQKAAARRNIKKAQAARKKKGGKKTASRRAPTRSSPKKKGGKKNVANNNGNGRVNQKALMSGFISGAIAPFARNALGPFGDGATALGVGIFQRDKTLQTIGALRLGETLSSGLDLSSGNGNGGNLI